MAATNFNRIELTSKLLIAWYIQGAIAIPSVMINLFFKYYIELFAAINAHSEMASDDETRDGK